MTRSRAPEVAVLRLTAVILLLAASSACLASDVEPSQRPKSAQASVAMSFGQLPSQVGTNQGLLRVVNTGHRQLAVTRVGLDWAGYGPPFLIQEDNLLESGQTIDFPVTLPPPDCSDVSGAVLGLVDTGDLTLRTRLDRAGRVLLRRNWGQACQEEFVHARITIEFGDSWRIRGAGPATAMVGHLRLTRRQGHDEVRLMGVDGSVLYDLVLPGPSTMPSSAAAMNVPLHIRPGNRCDEHARSQVTAPFAFRLTLSIGDTRAGVGLAPPEEVQATAPALLRRACD